MHFVVIVRITCSEDQTAADKAFDAHRFSRLIVEKVQRRLAVDDGLSIEHYIFAFKEARPSHLHRD